MGDSMTTQELVPEFMKRRDNLERLARRNGLQFHIDCYNFATGAPMDFGEVVEYDGEDSRREATSVEISMWHKITPPGFNPSSDLPATPEEVLYSLQYLKGPFTINAVDLVALRQLRDNFDPCTQRVQLLARHMGWFSTNKPKDPLAQIHYRGDDDPEAKPVYASRLIPVGFFYEGHHPELHNQVRSGVPRELAPEIPDELLAKVSMELRPFKVA
jgi:hypothetical protein